MKGLPGMVEVLRSTLSMIAVALVLNACGSAPPSALTPSASSQASGGAVRSNVAVKVSYNTAAATDLPYFVAEHEGYFRQQGLEVTMISMTPQVAIAALSKNEIDFMNSPTNSIEGATHGLPFKVVWTSWDGAAWTLIGKPEIASMGQLKGKTVATNNPGTAPYAYLRAGLQKNGMTVSDIQFLPSPGTSTVFASITAGKVDAGVISPPFDAQALEQGFREVMFLGDLLELPSNGLSTTSAYIAQNRSVVERMIRGLWSANRWITTHPDETAALLAQKLGTSPGVAKRAYDRMAPLLAKNGETTPRGIQQNLELLEEATGKPISIDPAQLVDFGPLHEMLAQQK